MQFPNQRNMPVRLRPSHPITRYFPESWGLQIMENLGFENVDTISDIFTALLNHNEPLTIDNAESRLRSIKEISDDEEIDSDVLKELVSIVTHPIWNHPKVRAIQPLVEVIDDECPITYALNEFNDLLQRQNPVERLQTLITDAQNADKLVKEISNLSLEEQQQYHDYDPPVWIFSTRSSGLTDLDGVMEEFTKLYD